MIVAEAAKAADEKRRKTRRGYGHAKFQSRGMWLQGTQISENTTGGKARQRVAHLKIYPRRALRIHVCKRRMQHLLGSVMESTQETHTEGRGQEGRELAEWKGRGGGEYTPDVYSPPRRLDIYPRIYQQLQQKGDTIKRARNAVASESNYTVRRHYQPLQLTVALAGDEGEREKSVRYPVPLWRVLHRSIPLPVPPLTLPVLAVMVQRTNCAVNRATLTTISSSASSMAVEAVASSSSFSSLQLSLLCGGFDLALSRIPYVCGECRARSSAIVPDLHGPSPPCIPYATHLHFGSL